MFINKKELALRQKANSFFVKIFNFIGIFLFFKNEINNFPYPIIKDKIFFP